MSEEIENEPYEPHAPNGDPQNECEHCGHYPEDICCMCGKKPTSEDQEQ